MKFKTLLVAHDLMKIEALKLEREYERLEAKLDSTLEDTDEYVELQTSRRIIADKLCAMRSALNDLEFFEIN